MGQKMYANEFFEKKNNPNLLSIYLSIYFSIYVWRKEWISWGHVNSKGPLNLMFIKSLKREPILALIYVSSTSTWIQIASI